MTRSAQEQKERWQALACTGDIEAKLQLHTLQKRLGELPNAQALYPECVIDAYAAGEPAEYFSAPSNYGPLLQSFGEILIQVDAGYYQGDRGRACQDKRTHMSVKKAKAPKRSLAREFAPGTYFSRWDDTMEMFTVDILVTEEMLKTQQFPPLHGLCPSCQSEVELHFHDWSCPHCGFSFSALQMPTLEEYNMQSLED